MKGNGAQRGKSFYSAKSNPRTSKLGTEVVKLWRTAMGNALPLTKSIEVARCKTFAFPKCESNKNLKCT